MRRTTRKLLVSPTVITAAGNPGFCSQHTRCSFHVTRGMLYLKQTMEMMAVFDALIYFLLNPNQRIMFLVCI